MTELHSQTETPVREGEPFYISAEYAEQNWAPIGHVIACFKPWSQLIDSDHVRQNVAAGLYELFGLISLDSLSLAVGWTFERNHGRVLGMTLFAPDDIDAGLLEKLIGYVEQFARERGCVALAIQALPWHASKVGGLCKAVVLERDLHRQEKERLN